MAYAADTSGNFQSFMIVKNLNYFLFPQTITSFFQNDAITNSNHCEKNVVELHLTLKPMTFV